MNRALGIVVLSVTLAAAGQLMLKLGMSQVGAIGVAQLADLKTLGRMFSNWRVVVGLALYATSALFYMVALSRVDISLAYPIVGLSYVAIALAAWLLLGEHVPPMRWAGIAIIVAGVLVVSRTG